MSKLAVSSAKSRRNKKLNRLTYYTDTIIINGSIFAVIEVDARKVIKILTKNGWEKVSQKGSHAKLKKGEEVPIHGSKDLKKARLRP